MKLTVFILAGFALVTSPFAVATPLATFDTWISPQAKAIREKINAAYSAIDGWTATIVIEQHTMENGVVKRMAYQTTERYFKSGGPTGYYAATNRIPDLNSAWAKCQDLAEERMVFLARGRLGGTISTASDFNRPEFWRDFELSIAHTDYARWVGQETVAGQTCDIVELTSLARGTPDAPQPLAGVTSQRYYVNASGLIERIMKASDDKSGSRTYWVDQRITYDANAKLAPEDFSRESFERDAAVVLQGKPMPELKEQVNAVGGTLPDMTFIGWPDGKPFRTSDLQGKVVVLETWASWCHFCKEAFPFYEKTRKALAGQDVVFVAVSFDKKIADYEKWMKQHGDSYGFKFGRVDSEDTAKAAQDFKAAFPAFYVLGRDGKIVSSYVGYGYGRGGEDPRLLAALRAAGVKIQ